MSAKLPGLKRWLNLWPPFLFSGIRASRISKDCKEVDVVLKEYWFNRNYVRTHFGGSLFAMTDPWYMLMLMDLLGRDYIVWDQRSAIEFVKPGRGTVTAQFRLSDDVVAEIRSRTASGDKYLPEFLLDITDEAGEVVARVRKTLYVRRKRTAGAAAACTGSSAAAAGNASAGTSGPVSAVPASASSELPLR